MLIEYDREGAFICLASKMRVIAGQFKGVRLFAPKNRQIRPTTDRVREYIFSCIQEEIKQARVADLFAGTGALGIEALSRGAESVVFVDSSGGAMSLLEKNLAKTGIQAALFKKTVESFLITKGSPKPFHFIFCDPPYKYDHFENILELIRKHELLEAGGVIIYESNSRQSEPIADGYSIVRKKTMGETKITFYRNDHVKDSDLSRNI